jgi:predicted ATPase
LAVRGFKSLVDVNVDLPRLTVLFGPNAAGKSNFLDAIQALSRIATSRTLSEALSEPIRGYPVEAFAFPQGGLPALLQSESAAFTLEADLSVEKESYRYLVEVGIQPRSGSLNILNEYLAVLGKGGQTKGSPSVERVNDKLRIRRKSKPAHPREEPIGLNHSMISDPRLGGVEYRPLERCRQELSGWRTYYLDPRLAMRSANPPKEVTDIGVLGQDIAPFLYRLRVQSPKDYAEVQRALRSLIPGIEELSVDLDEKRGTLDVRVRQEGADFSSRIVSEGTLRVLALCAIAVNPWSGSLLAFEEPENGVHPRRLDLMARLLCSMALEQGRQVIVTTHSPRLCGMLLRESRIHSKDIALLRVKQEGGKSHVSRFQTSGPLFDDPEIREALSTKTEEGIFQELLVRGMVDE